MLYTKTYALLTTPTSSIDEIKNFLWLTKMIKSPLYHINEFSHKDKKNNIICHSENKGEEITAVNIGLLPYKALKQNF